MSKQQVLVNRYYLFQGDDEVIQPGFHQFKASFQSLECAKDAASENQIENNIDDSWKDDKFKGVDFSSYNYIPDWDGYWAQIVDMETNEVVWQMP